MKRKRFVKLLMARGYSRNYATQVALHAVSNGHTFEGVYFAVRVNDGDPEAVEAMREAVFTACEKITEIVAGWVSAISEAAQKIEEAMPAMVKMMQTAKEQLEAAIE